jgi:hypothetical protein
MSGRGITDGEVMSNLLKEALVVQGLLEVEVSQVEPTFEDVFLALASK